jgi:hypothetical protein
MDTPGEKLLIKLWETLAEKGIGKLLGPWQESREARARLAIRRDEMLMLAQAQNDVDDIRAGRKQLRSDGTLLLNTEAPHARASDGRLEPTLQLSTAMIHGQEAAALGAAQSEINASKAILYAEEQLSTDPQAPPDQSIDEDWLFTWRELAGRTSTEDLQRLWGSVLAGEVKAPGKYSIRTLEFLKTLSKAEAELISRMANFAINGRIVRSQEAFLETKGLTFTIFLEMQELGILSGAESAGITTTYRSNNAENFSSVLISHNKALVISHEDASKTFQLEVYLLTAVGMQVIGLGSFEPDPEYLLLVAKDILKQGFTVQIADWRYTSETSGAYFNGQPVHEDPPATDT